MKNTKIALFLFFAILAGCILSNKFTKSSINKLENQVSTIYGLAIEESSIEEKIVELKTNFLLLKPYLEGLIDKEFIHQINIKLNLLEESIKEKDITQCKENCIEIMSLLDNIECYYMSVI